MKEIRVTNGNGKSERRVLFGGAHSLHLRTPPAASCYFQPHSRPTQFFCPTNRTGGCFYKKTKFDWNLHKFDLWPLAAMKAFLFWGGCVSRNDRFLWDGCPSDWMFMFYLWKAFWWHQMNGMTQPLVAQRINKFWLQKSKGGRMKNTFAAILKRVKTYRHTRDTRVTHSGEPMMTCMCFTSFWLFLFSYFSIQ